MSGRRLVRGDLCIPSSSVSRFVFVAYSFEKNSCVEVN
jgi:hypothetical protein